MKLVQLLTGVLERTERVCYMELRNSGIQARDVQALHKQSVESIRRRDPVMTRKAVVNDIAQGKIDYLILVT
ncbi:MAG: hypothetical protein AB1898_29855 [Acidobacteriota bacterium]